ncbi:GGDEF domain-containing protein [Defluviimonas sp. SAOS-178_SWC]|uniref:GGDEF domain-containing protein n=1 Tax=Defluviimonas sp. SAOS-178_SWC TaxID=3121287 RepID=UPI003221758F
MDGPPRDDPVLIGIADLGRLMPMYLWIAPTGHIRAVGPTLSKLFQGVALAGLRFLDVFEIRKPQAARSMDEVRRLAGQRLHLALREKPRTGLRGLVVPLQDGQGMVVNLSFGIAAAEAVRDHALTNADFAPTDLTVELLYLTEVKAAVMEELAALNARLRTAQRTAEEQALTDALTGLANRRALDHALVRVLDAAARGGRGFALLHLDIDFFKAVNDTFGHAAGDLVLSHVAAILRRATRKQDIVARVGGDEFVMILPGPVDEAMVATIARRIIAELEVPVMFEGAPCRISGSIGATLSGLYERPDADRMLSDADAALYVSKRRGRAQCTIYGPGLHLPEDQRGAAGRP